MARDLVDEDYRRLLNLRDGLRRFLDWSAERATEAGLTPAQHQLLLVIRGLWPVVATVGDVADHLLIRHHSAVQLVDRAERAGLVERSIDPADHRVVRLRLTGKGEQILSQLSAQHWEELERLGRYGRWLLAGFSPRESDVP